MARKPDSDREFRELRRSMVRAGLAVLAVFTIGVTGYTVLGRGEHRLLDSLYMTVITLTTVGYGEIINTSDNPAARVFTMVLILFGMGILVYFASTVTAFIVGGHLKEVFWRKRMRQAIAALKDHTLVCGGGAVAGYVARELSRVRRPLVAVVPAGSEPGWAGQDVLRVDGDPSDEQILAEAGIGRASGLVAALESDRDNVLVTLTARQIRPDVRIVAMAADQRSEGKLRRAGADAVVTPFLIGGLRIASEMIRPAVVTFLDSMLRDRDRNLRIEELRIGAGSPAIGRDVAALELDAFAGLLLLAVRESDGARYHFKPSPDLELSEGATLIVMGDPAGVAELRARFGTPEPGGASAVA